MAVAEPQQMPLRMLRPNPANPRAHSRRQIEQIAQSIRQFGFTSPIIVDENWLILAGHGRWLAAKTIGLTQVPVVKLTGLSAVERRAYALADNKLGENAGWDRHALAIELRDLQLELEPDGLDIGITGFAIAEVDDLVGGLVDPEQDPLDELPPISGAPVSRCGDVWLLGQHRVGCGDAKANADISKLMGRDKAAMVFADPPFHLPAPSIQGRGRSRHDDSIEGAGELPHEEFSRLLIQSLSLAAVHSIEGSVHIVCIDWRHLSEILAAGRQVYDRLVNLVVWTKTNSGQGSFHRSEHELLFVFKHGSARNLDNVELGRHRLNGSNVWTHAGVTTLRAGSDHPTVKPVALVADAMRDCTRRGDIVLDPFVGSGTSILAAERVGRRGYGLDLDPRYVDAAIRRWQGFTRRDATLEGTRKSFEEIAADRGNENAK